jgi:hypothetical protein
MFKRGAARNAITFNLINATQSIYGASRVIPIFSLSKTSAQQESRYLVDWGDGKLVAETSLTTKTYSTPFTGTVSVSLMRGNPKFHIYAFGSTSSNGNPFQLANLDVNYNTFKQITNLKQITYFNQPPEGATPSTSWNKTIITGTFSNICDDLPYLKLLLIHSLKSKTSAYSPDDYRIDINNLKNLTSISLENGNNTITGNINNIATNNPYLTYLNLCTSTVNASVTGSIASFSQSIIKTLNIEGSTGLNTVSGDIGLLPSTLVTLNLGGLNTTTGSIANLPASLTYYKNYGRNTTTGDITDLKSSLTNFLNGGRESPGSNRTTGNIANLKPGLLVYQNYGSNTTFGDIGTLPILMTSYSNLGLNTTTGDIGSMSIRCASMSTYINYGYNTTTGDIGLLPATMSNYTNGGSNSTYGNIGALPTGLLTYLNEGSNTTNGSIANLPTKLTYYLNSGSNSTSGDIGSMSARCTALGYYSNTGLNTTTGNIGFLGNIYYYYNGGSNTVYGNIASFSTKLTNFLSYGSSSVTGDIATLRPIIRDFLISSDFQSTYGNLYYLPTSINRYYNIGSTTCSFTASGGSTKYWDNLWQFTHRPKIGYGLTSSEIDQLLISLSQSYWVSTGSKVAYLDGNNGPRTSASDDAVRGLSARGIQVRVNGRFGAN